MADYVTFSLGRYGYYIYYQLKEDEEDYSFITGSYSEYNIKIFNKTHFRLYINETFSDAPEINYTLAIYETKPRYDYDINCRFFKNYYLNQSSDEANNSEIYYFLNSNLINNPNETEYIYYLNLPFPKKFNFHKPNQKFIYKLMGITGPKYKYVKIYDIKYLLFCYETCSECSDVGIVDEHNCTSCLEGKVLFSGYINYDEYRNVCLYECPIGYYEKDNICKSCYETCERCLGSGDEENNNCLSCYLKLSYKYLINAPGLVKNCVNKCPEGTVLKKMNVLKQNSP